MPPDMQPVSPPRISVPARPSLTEWQAACMRLALVSLALVLAFLPDWAAMARQWWDISTYNHVLLVPAIIGWLAWQRAGELAKLPPVTWWPGLLVSAAAMAIWTLGAFSGLDLFRQLGAVLLPISACLVLLGPHVAAGLAFPLCYALFLVPFGGDFVPALQMITAAITIALVEWSGIPAEINGVFIDTPAGLFEVAEACSGVKFLIAMIAFGALLANVCFTSWKRRALLIAACIAVPVLANGFRAFATIYVAQSVGAEAATGFDHIVYGWLFFAVVLAIVIAGAWRYFDRPAGEPMIDAGEILDSRMLARASRWRIAPLPALAVLLFMVTASHAWVRASEQLAADLPGEIGLPEVPGWHLADYEPRIWWEPRAEGADHRLLGRYRDAAGREVDVFFALYASQGEGREAGGFGQGALTPDSAWSWLAPGPAFEGAMSERLLAEGRVERLALTWYRSGGVVTGSNARLKLSSMADRLLLRRRATVMLILSAEEADGRPALEAVEAFAAAAGPLDRWMDRIAGLD
jgi:exosortase A